MGPHQDSVARVGYESELCAHVTYFCPLRISLKGNDGCLILWLHESEAISYLWGTFKMTPLLFNSWHLLFTLIQQKARILLFLKRMIVTHPRRAYSCFRILGILGLSFSMRACHTFCDNTLICYRQLVYHYICQLIRCVKYFLALRILKVLLCTQSSKLFGLLGFESECNTIM